MSPPAHHLTSPLILSVPSLCIFPIDAFCLVRQGGCWCPQARALPDPEVGGSIPPLSTFGSRPSPPDPRQGLNQFCRRQQGLPGAEQVGGLPLGLIFTFFLEKALQDSWEISQLEMGIICHPSTLPGAPPCGKVDRHMKMVLLSTHLISLEMIYT